MVCCPKGYWELIWLHQGLFKEKIPRSTSEVEISLQTVITYHKNILSTALTSAFRYLPRKHAFAKQTTKLTELKMQRMQEQISLNPFRIVLCSCRSLKSPVPSYHLHEVILGIFKPPPKVAMISGFHPENRDTVMQVRLMNVSWHTSKCLLLSLSRAAQVDALSSHLFLIIPVRIRKKNNLGHQDMK